MQHERNLKHVAPQNRLSQPWKLQIFVELHGDKILNDKSNEEWRKQDQQRAAKGKSLATHEQHECYQKQGHSEFREAHDQAILPEVHIRNPDYQRHIVSAGKDGNGVSEQIQQQKEQEKQQD